MSVVLAAFVLLITVAVANTRLLDSAELQGYDLLVSARASDPVQQDVVIVDFDDPTVTALGEYPIPRRILADVIQQVAKGEPDLIGLDFFLSEKRTPEEDQKLAEVLSDTGNVIIASNFGSDQIPSNDPLPEFREHALGVAFVNIPIDEDGFIRRFFLAMRTTAYSGVSFPVALAINHIRRPIEPAGQGVFRLGSAVIPLDGLGPNTALIGCWNCYRKISALRLVRGEIDSTSAFRRKIVIIGQSSSSGKDLYNVPVSRFGGASGTGAQLSGAEVHAAALETLLSGKTIRVLGKRSLWTWNFLFIWLVVCAVVKLKPQVSIALAIAGIFGVYLFAQTLLAHERLWMRFVSTEAGVSLSLTAGMAYRFVNERRLKYEAEAERRVLERELELARAIQESLLPEAPPIVDGVDIGVRHQTSLLVGGDYYDFILLKPCLLLFVIADVEGKGASSALIMSNLQASLHALLLHNQSLEFIVPTLNVCMLRNRTNKLITLFIGLLDVSRRELRYVNAGHLPPVVMRSAGDQSFLRDGGMLIGAFPSTNYDCGVFRLEPGDVLLAYTDGITEATDRADEQYGCERMVHAAVARRKERAQEIVNAIVSDEEAFSAGGTHQDDKVMMVIKLL